MAQDLKKAIILHTLGVQVVALDLTPNRTGELFAELLQGLLLRVDETPSYRGWVGGGLLKLTAA